MTGIVCRRSFWAVPPAQRNDALSLGAPTGLVPIFMSMRDLAVSTLVIP